MEDFREQRGKVIAATCQVKFKNGAWTVPSQNIEGKRYTVDANPDCPHCTCPDFEEREMKCKHIYAVMYTLEARNNRNGTVTVTETLTVEKRRTYPQNWSAYNEAATTEKRWFLSLLADLCAGIPQPERKPTRGQQPVRLSDAIYAACFKVFSGYSA